MIIGLNLSLRCQSVTKIDNEEGNKWQNLLACTGCRKNFLFTKRINVFRMQMSKICKYNLQDGDVLSLRREKCFACCVRIKLLQNIIIFLFAVLLDSFTLQVEFVCLIAPS